MFSQCGQPAVLGIRSLSRIRPFHTLSINSRTGILYVSRHFCLHVDPSWLDADIVCSRAKNHYDPRGTVDFSDSATQADTSQAEGALEAFKRGFKPLHANMQSVMYFS